MKDGSDKLVKLLEDAEKDAEFLERQLPHTADRIRMLIKYIKAYDKNQKTFIKYFLDTQRAIKIWQKILKLTATYLTPAQTKYTLDYLEELKHDAKRTDTDAGN